MATPTNPRPEDDATTTAATITLGVTTYRVEHVTTDHARSTYLIGPNGARYYLRPYSGPDTGLRSVISMTTGAPLRKHGNRVRVHQLGDVIELAPPRR